jgi:hypothetical protein
MTDFAKQVAKQIEKRQRRRKLVWWCAIAAAIALALVYLRCGRGWGIGGSGEGARTAVPVTPADARAWCEIRLAVDGIAVDGKRATRAEAVSACRALGRAVVVVTGDAREGDWTELREALDAAHVRHTP